MFLSVTFETSSTPEKMLLYAERMPAVSQNPPHYSDFADENRALNLAQHCSEFWQEWTATEMPAWKQQQGVALYTAHVC